MRGSSFLQLTSSWGLLMRASNEAMAAWIAARGLNWLDEIGSPISTRV
jgi:hypothetical protein